jgi:hypothetical protein
LSPARDASGHGFHCQLRDLDPATAWVKGRVGGAIDLGRKGWLECPLPEARAGVPFDMSVAVWMKRLGPNHHSALLTRQLANDEKFHFWFGLRGDLLAVHGDAWKGWTSRTLTSFDDWTHVAFVHAGSETRLYVDGVLARYKNARWPGGRGDDLRPRAHGQRGGDSGRTLTRTPEGPLASIWWNRNCRKFHSPGLSCQRRRHRGEISPVALGGEPASVDRARGDP